MRTWSWPDFWWLFRGTFLELCLPGYSGKRLELQQNYRIESGHQCLQFFLLHRSRLKKPQIIAVSIETAFQNGSIAFIILQLSLPSPFNDIATVGPIAQLIFTGVTNHGWDFDQTGSMVMS